MTPPSTKHSPPLGLENATASELMGMDPARGTREKLIRTGMDLVYEHGFHDVGLDRIIDAAGVTKTTFYNHFESKDAFLVDVIRVRDTVEVATFERMTKELARVEEPRALLLAMFDVLDAWFTSPAFHGCLFINAALAFPNPADPVHQAAARHPAMLRQLVLNYTRWLRVDDPDELADQLVLLMQGALAMRAAADRDNAGKTARRMAEQLIDAAMAS